MKMAWRIYRRLAQAFPHEFKLAYGAEMMLAGEDVVQEIAARRGVAGLIPLIADIAWRLPVEYLTEVRQDMRYAMRALVKSPGFALVGIVSMGLGIGLTTNVYGTRWALLTRELPAAANASRLAIAQNPVSYFYIEQYRSEKRLFDGVAAMQNDVPFNLTFQGDAKAERAFGQLVSPDYFSVLGVDAQRGRLLNPELDKPGDAPVVVISDRFWRDRLDASPFAVGQTLRLNGQTATIVGITPRSFDGALSMHPAALFVPTTVPATMAPELANDVLHQRNAKDWIALMCLKRGVSIDSAEAALDGITRRLDVLDKNAPRSQDKALRVTLIPAGTRVPVPRNMRPALEGFFVVLMGLILTIACMNLATMLLARGANRRRELAIRLGVGASRFRLVRQMVSEGILLSVLGGIAGLALAFGLNVLNTQFPQPAGAQPMPDIALDWHAGVFAFAVAVVCGIGFSLAPALQATKTDVAPTLKEGSALQLPGYRRFGLRNLAVVAQVTGSLMLLLITGFLVIGLSQANSIETRFDPKTMVFVSIDPVRDGYTPEKAQALFQKLTERLRESGKVRSFALATAPPFASNDDDDAEDYRLTVDDAHGAPAGAGRVEKAVGRETVGAGYFAALNEPMLAGREFAEADERSIAQARNGGEAVPGAAMLSSANLASAILAPAILAPAILNESAARELFGNENAIGRRVHHEKQSYEVIGVVRDLKDENGIVQPIVYEPLTPADFARPPAGGITIIARSDAGTDALSSLRGVLASLDPKLTLFNVETMSEYLERSRYIMWGALRTYGGIGIFGLILSAVGLAGVTGYAVARRRKEIGIRMALGSSKGRVLRLVLREGVTLIAVGTVLGFAGAIALVKALSAMTHIFVEAFKEGTNDPRLLLGAPLLLAGLAMLACYVPARRAAQIDPLKALRQE
jgi:macrolide transport system ATP-binding/permease protein